MEILNIRTGIGFDVHRLTAGRQLVLGGVIIPYKLGLLGHSDADVLIHAMIDALLGAASMGDIGGAFPDTDHKFKDISSLKLLATTASRLQESGYTLINIDTVVAAEQPKLAPHIAAMRSNIAKALGTETDRVSIKATTTEKLGYTGRGEGIAAWATALIYKNSKPPK